MPHPIIIVASLLTTVKTTWELSRIVHRKRIARILKLKVPRLYRILQQAYRERILCEREFDYLLERLIIADANKD
ncbi:hypothetical protein GE09DRAFT_932134, partial [Coniochaeta sp. 2T2.1]